MLNTFFGCLDEPDQWGWLKEMSAVCHRLQIYFSKWYQQQAVKTFHADPPSAHTSQCTDTPSRKHVSSVATAEAQRCCTGGFLHAYHGGNNNRFLCGHAALQDDSQSDRHLWAQTQHTPSHLPFLCPPSRSVNHHISLFSDLLSLANNWMTSLCAVVC